MAKKKNAAAVELGSKGGIKRAQTMTPEQRSKQARKAARARWDQFKEKPVVSKVSA